MKAVLVVLPRCTAWFMRHPWDSHVDLCSSGATTYSSSSSSSITALLPLRSSREQLGHHSLPHQWGTHATLVGRLGTSLRNAAYQDMPSHLIL
jgi:hypothetical protein